jgi:hypothetical protein
MPLEPTSNTQQRVRQLRALLASQAVAGTPAAMLESGARRAGPDAPLPPPDEILGRVESILLRMPSDEVDDPQAFRKALDTLLRQGDSALQRLARPNTAGEFDLAADHLASLEAIVIADGSRPSFLLRDGRVATDHPFIGEWAPTLDKRAAQLQAVAATVGRIEGVDGSAANYFGTGTLVDREAGLVLSNFHVVDDARQRGIAMSDSGASSLRVESPLFIDFGAEVSSLERGRFRVVSVALPALAGRQPGQLDAAVLHIEPDATGPTQLPLVSSRLSSDIAFATGASPTLCTIGFSGPPKQVSPPGALIDWDFVVSTLFGNRFGFKRLAPGRFVAPPGTVAGDSAQRVLTHDATTFGGASGSLLLAWEEARTPAFALHFAGRTGKENQAIALAVVAQALRDVGVTLTD